MSLPADYQKQLDNNYISSKSTYGTSSVTKFKVVKNILDLDLSNLFESIRSSVKDSNSKDELPSKKAIKQYIGSLEPITYTKRPEIFKSLIASMNIKNKLTASDELKNRLTNYQTVVYKNYEIDIEGQFIPIPEVIDKSGDYLSGLSGIDEVKVETLQNFTQVVTNSINEQINSDKELLEYVNFDEEGFKAFYSETTPLSELKRPIDNWIRGFKGNNQFLGNYTVYIPGTSIKMIDFDFASIFRKIQAFLTNDPKLKFEPKVHKDYFSIQAETTPKGSNLAQSVASSKDSFKRRSKNPFIEDMLKAGPDLYSNMFDVYLRFNIGPSYSKSTSTDMSLVEPKYYFLNLCPIDVYNTSDMTLEPNKVMNSLTEDVYSLSVRTASVEIPMATRSTFKRNLAGTSCDIPATEVDMNYEASLSIDLDANNYVADMFLALSGYHRRGYVSDGKKASVFNNYPFMSAAKLGLEGTSIDLIVSVHSLSPFSSSSVNPYIGDGGKSKISYVFKDVRFLGVGDTINFGREASGAVQISVPFIYKQLRQHYRVDNTLKSGMATNDTNVEYNSDFNKNYSSVLEENTVS